MGCGSVIMEPFGDDYGCIKPGLFKFLMVTFPLSWFGPIGFFINAGLYFAILIIILIKITI